ncbi:hypothetical protein [Thauera aromatica]|nr:hypothetical protein [Thauera aromatica]
MRAEFMAETEAAHRPASQVLREQVLRELARRPGWMRFSVMRLPG